MVVLGLLQLKCLTSNENEFWFPKAILPSRISVSGNAVKTSIKLPKPETWVFSLTFLSLPRFPHPVLHLMLLLEVSLEASRSPHFLNNYPLPPSWVWMIATVPNCISRHEPFQCAPKCSQNVLSKMQISLCLNLLKSFRGSPLLVHAVGCLPVQHHLLFLELGALSWCTAHGPWTWQPFLFPSSPCLSNC